MDVLCNTTFFSHVLDEHPDTTCQTQPNLDVCHCKWPVVHGEDCYFSRVAVEDNMNLQTGDLIVPQYSDVHVGGSASSARLTCNASLLLHDRALVCPL